MITGTMVQTERKGLLDFDLERCRAKHCFRLARYQFQYVSPTGKKWTDYGCRRHKDERLEHGIQHFQATATLCGVKEHDGLVLPNPDDIPDDVN